MLDLRKVNHVIEIARQGGFAKAAATLNITQSALTRSVQILEDNLGIQVFERGPRGIRLTREGEQFIEGGTKLLEERSEEHTSELQSLMRISYAVFCLKQKNT